MGLPQACSILSRSALFCAHAGEIAGDDERCRGQVAAQCFDAVVIDCPSIHFVWPSQVPVIDSGSAASSLGVSALVMAAGRRHLLSSQR